MIWMTGCTMVYVGNQAMRAGMAGDLLGDIRMALGAEFMLFNFQGGVTKATLGFKLSV